MANRYAQEGLKILNALVPEDNPYAFKLDEDGNPLQPILVLCKRNGDRINTIENATNIKQVFSFSSVFELSFDVSEYANGKRCTVWDELKDFKLVYLPQYKLWYEIYVTTKEDNGLTKSVTATHLNEAELSQVNLYGIEINTEDDLKLHDYAPTVFYNPENPKLSLINRLLNKVPHYTIYHVDESLMKLQRNFEFDGDSIIDAFDEIAEECDCVFIFGEGADDSGSITRTVSVYDMLDVCQDCGERGEFDDGFCTECSSTNIKSRYGEDTNVFITNENLANEITYSNNTDSIKNCFHFEAGDDLMTASIMDCNMGSQYVWYMPEETRLEMSAELQDKLVHYDADNLYYTNEHVSTFDSAITSAYNEVVYKYKAKNSDLTTIFSITGYSPLVENYYHAVDLEVYLQTSMMPTTTLDETSASEQISYLTPDNMSPIGVQKLSTMSVSTADSAVKAYAKVYVDSSKYEITISNSKLNGTTWSGLITLKSYSDEEDTATTAISITFNEDAETFTKQKIDKLLAKYSDVPSDVVALFNLDLDEFKNEIKNHSADNLDMFLSCSEDIINVLIEDGHYETDDELNEKLYKPHLEKSEALKEELKLRQNEIESVQAMEKTLNTTISEINKKMSLESYLGDLWVEYISYRREDEYSNTNYISDGLTNKELIEQAQLFYKALMREIKKSATLQHNIETSLKNLMLLPEFKPILYKFQLANWLRIKIDGTIYKLRLDEYTIDYENLDELSVSFTDVRAQNSVIAQVKRTFAQNKSKSSSYSSTPHQMVSTQTVVSSTTGVLVRNYDNSFENFKTGQLRILSNGIYYTDDSWTTVQSVRETIGATQDKIAEIMKSAGGLFTTEETQDDGSTIFYLHNKPELSDSGTIWKMTSDAFAVSTDGGETWNAGITMDGELISKILTSIGVNANWINAGALNIYDDDGKVVFHAGIDDKTVILNGDSVFINSDGLTIGDAIDMAKMLTVSLSPSVQTVATDTDGSYTEFPETVSTATVKFGNADVTSECTFELKESDGVEADFNVKTHKLSVTGLKKDSAELFLVAHYSGVEATGQLSVIKQKAIYSITEIKNYYNVSESDTTAPTEWLEDIPTMTEEKRYLWNYEITTYSDKTTNQTQPRVIGVYGETGSAPSIVSTAITYVQSEDGITAPTDGWETNPPIAIAGQYVWSKTTVTYSDGATTLSYSVSKNGTNGEDGISNYIHYAYANSADGKTDFSTTDSVGKSYIGICTDTNKIDPSSYDKYSWSLIKGADGISTSVTVNKNEDGTVSITTTDSSGVNTVVVDKGADGTSITIKSKEVSYAISASGTTTPTSGWNTAVQTATTDKPYLWTRTTVVYSDGTNDTTTTSYSVSKYGFDGTNGTNSYVHIAYATSADGSEGFSTTDPTDKTYIGIYTDSNKSDSTTASDYVWSLMKGADGTSSTIKAEKQTDGSVKITVTDKDGSEDVIVDKGTDGTSVTISSKSVTYAISASGTTAPTSWQSTIQTPTTTSPYLWTKTYVKYSDNSETTAYSVSKYGFDGENGKSNYIHYAYATSADGSEGFSTTDSTGKTYIGICTDNTEIDPITASSYTWSLIKGADGTDGKSASISATKNSDGSVTITTTDPSTGSTTTTVDKGADGTSITIKSKEVSYAISASGTTTPTSGWNTAVQTATTDKPYLWTRTTVVYSDGTSTISYSVGYKGKDGENGVSITSITEYYLASPKSSGITSADLISTEIPEITETNKFLWNCEVVNFSDGTSSEKTTPVIIGVYGATGKTGVGIASVTSLYYCSDKASTPDKPSTPVTDTTANVYNAWSKTVSNATSEYKYYFMCNEVKYDDDSYWWTDVVSDVGVQTAFNAQTSADEANSSAKDISDRVTSIDSQLNDNISRLDSDINDANDNIAKLDESLNKKIDSISEELSKSLSDYKDEVKKYIKFNSSDGLVLGATSEDGTTESPFRTVISNTSMQFQQDGQKIAEINNKQLAIPSAVITDLTLGNFVFHTRTDGGLSIIWHSS